MMKLSELKVGIRYLVTNPSKCRSLQVGDSVYMDKDGDLLNDNACGWLDSTDVKKLKGVELEVNKCYYINHEHKLRAELLEVQHILEGLS